MSDHNEPNPIAPPGKVWVCLACGKRANDQTRGGISRGWDVSCMLNSQLFDESQVVIENGRVVRVGA